MPLDYEKHKEHMERSALQAWETDNKLKELIDHVNNNTVDNIYKGSLNINKYTKSLKSLPDFSNIKIMGSFNISNCTLLETLKGCPKVITGDFDASFCSSLTDLEYGPKYVGLDYIISGCHKLTSLKGMNDCEVGNDLFAVHCINLKSLEGISRNIKEEMRVDGFHMWHYHIIKKYADINASVLEKLINRLCL
jgi:hypothetical protein